MEEGYLGDATLGEKGSADLDSFGCGGGDGRTFYRRHESMPIEQKLHLKR